MSAHLCELLAVFIAHMELISCELTRTFCKDILDKLKDGKSNGTGEHPSMTCLRILS